MRLKGYKAALASMLVTFFVVGCANDGFRATKGNNGKAGAKTKAADPAAVRTDGATPGVLPSIAVQSPRAQAVFKVADASGIQMEKNNLSKLNAQQILGTEVETTEEGLKNKVVTFRALVELNGFVGVVKSEVNIDPTTNGLAIVSEKVTVDETSILEGSVEALANFSFQTVSHCTNACKDLFVHFQINKGGQYFSAAFYNFRLDKNNQYAFLSSSVDEEYRNLADAKVYLLQTHPASDDLEMSTMDNAGRKPMDGSWVPTIHIEKPVPNIPVPEVKAPEIVVPEVEFKAPAPAAVTNVPDPAVADEVVVVRAKRLTPEQQIAALTKEVEELRVAVAAAKTPEEKAELEELLKESEQDLATRTTALQSQ